MVKVAVLGAGGGVGQALSLQIRLSPFVDELALYGRDTAFGIAVDLSHIPVKQNIKGYKAKENGLAKALTGADIVVITAGSPMTSLAAFTHRNDFLESNTTIVGPYIEACGTMCAKALIMIVTSPLNALVPFAAEILKKCNAFDARRLFGVTTLDVVRSETFLAEALATIFESAAGMRVNVIGGHSAETIVPLFSQVEGANKLSSVELDSLVHHVQNGGMEVYSAKDKLGTATLSTAYATFRLVERACRALKGEKGMTECSFVHLPGIKDGKEIVEALGLDYFSVPIEFALDGANRIINPLQGLSAKEAKLVEIAVKELDKDIKQGEEAGIFFLDRSSNSGL